MTTPFELRLLSRVERRDCGHATPCWIWTGSTRRGRGYGQIKVGGRMVATHRAAYELFVGEVPNGMQIDHLCRMRACVNPTHLEPVTSRENTLRGTSPSAINAAKTHCMRGHAFDAENTRRKANGSRECRACRRAAKRRVPQAA